MGVEQQAKFVLTLEGKDDNLLSLFAAFKKSVRSDVAEIERITNNVKLFGNLDADLKKSAAAVDDTRARLAKLRDTANEVQKAGGSIGDDLTKGIKEAEKAAASAEKTFIKQSEAVDKLRTSLVAAGVDVTNLAKAEEKLAIAAKAAAAAATEQAQKQTLNFKSLKDIAPEVAKVNAAYTALATSGKLSFGELSGLHARATQQVAKIREEVGGVGTAFRNVRTSLIGFAAAFAGFVAVSSKGSEDFRAFSTQIAAIDTIADVSKGRLKELENGVRALARSMGVDAVNSAQALYDIIGSGIPVDNALEVLAKSTQAARAGLTDVKTAASAGVAVLNAYGLQAGQLDHVLDVMFQTVRDGVITFPQLAQNIGNTLPIARAANVRFEELGASFATLTRIGIDAPESATAIARAIQDLAAPAPEAAERMRELGIEFRGLTGTIEQFSKLNLGFDQIKQLIPEARAAKAVLGLSQSFSFLSEQVDLAAKSAGQMKEAYEKMADTPQARTDRYNAALKDLSISIGQFVTSATPFIQKLTEMLNAFNGLPEKTKQAAVEIAALVIGITALGLAIKVLAVPVNLLAAALTAIGPAGTTAAVGLTAAKVAMLGFNAAVAAFIGYKIGEVLYEQFPFVRRMGDVLGTVAASVDVLVSAIGGALFGALTLNKQALIDTWEQFKRNSAIIKDDFSNALSGAAERARQTAADLGLVSQKLDETSRAAVKSAGEVGTAVGAILSKLGAEAAAVEAALNLSAARVTSLNEALKKDVANIGSAASSAIGNLAAQVSEKLASLKSVDVKLITETVAIQKQAAIDRLGILKKFGEDSIAAFNAEADTRRAIALKAGESTKAVDREVTQARVANLQSIVDKFRSHLDTLLGMQRQHLDRVRELENERRGINEDAEEKIRAIRRQTLSEYRQYQDRVNEIDQLISKARQALAAGDQKLAEQYANKAIQAASSVSTAVKEGETEVVSASRAQSTAIEKITSASKVLLDVNKQRTEAEKEGAAAAADGIAKTLPLLQQYEKTLTDVSEKAKEGITLKAKIDVEDAEAAVTKLIEQVGQREAVLNLRAEVKEALDAVTKAKNEIEKGKIDVNLVAKTDKLDEAVKKVQDARPELTVETTAALAKIDDLKTKALALSEVKPQIDATVNSNVADVQKQIEDLKKPTESTHTVHIKVDNPAGAPVSGGDSGGSEPAPGFNRGGFVGGRGVQRLARGGFAGKVPGTGDGDTVRADLQAGQFVIRKSASRFYGDGIMRALARGVSRFAEGGKVTKEDAEKWANSGGTSDPPLNFDARQIPEVFVTAANVIAYAREMLNAVGAENPLLGDLKPTILQGITAVERNPGDKNALRVLLQAAETIGSNFQIFNLWGKTASTGNLGLNPVWFVDWLAKRGFNVADAEGKAFGIPTLSEFAKRFFKTSIAGAGAPSNILFGNPNRNIKGRFAEGGSTDTVPALLTPGEFVMRKSAVSRFGAGFMSALNRMAIPRAAIANLLAPPRVARFATGGAVGETGRVPFAPSAAAVAGVGNTYNISIAADINANDFVRRKLIPVLDEIDRRKGR